MKPRAAAFTAAIACTIALAAAYPAHAAALHRGSFDEVPADTVQIDYPLKIADAAFSSSDPAFKVSSSDDVWGVAADVVIYDKPVETDERIESGFTLTWQHAGKDADGDDIDLSLSFGNIEIGAEADDLLLLDDGIGLCLDALTTGSGNPAVRMEVSCTALKSGTTTPATGTLLVGFVDIDIVLSWPEQVELLSGFGPDVWVPSTNFLDISPDATRFTAAGPDDDTYDSGFVTTGQTSGFTLRWQGWGCGTCILQPFNLPEQIITAEAGPGGSISDPGETIVRWKNDKAYTITPDEDYSIKDVLVDGKSVGAVAEYTFREVTESHTIRAEFEPVPKHTVTFVDGFGETLSVQQVKTGEAALAPDDPTHEGWQFAGWDNDFENVTQDMTITALWEPLIAVRVPTLVACRILEDGSVLAPSGYAMENLSPVAVELESATTEDMPAYASYELAQQDGTLVHAFSAGEDAPGAALRIEAGKSESLLWSIGDIAGEDAQELLAAALAGPAHLCDVTFQFKRADA